MKKIPDIIKQARRKLRDTQTESESIFWENVRAKKLGLKFQRQFPVYLFTEDNGQDRYIIPDFYCSEKKLIIEIDGNIHNRNDVYQLDTSKESILKQQGYNILRYSNKYILDNSSNLGIMLMNDINLLQPLALEKSEDSGESLNINDESRARELKTKRFTMRNESFLCDNCGKEISKHPSGSARNHCPYCLHSKHLDKEFPGDRASVCHAIMRPIGKDYHKNKGWMVVHECIKCGKKIPNKLAEDDDVEAFGRL